MNVLTGIGMILRETYYHFTKFVENLMKKLDEAGWKKYQDYILVSSRLKSADSFLEKMHKHEEGKPKYPNPTEITDIACIRIVGCTVSDMHNLSPFIERNFLIDTVRSEDKSKKLGVDKVGYRSTNYVAALKHETLNTNSDLKFEGICFKIQVKSILDFAWDAIEHDRNYKFLSEYPEGCNIPRRFNLMAGLLEIADNELEHLSEQATSYVARSMLLVANDNYHLRCRQLSSFVLVFRSSGSEAQRGQCPSLNGTILSQNDHDSDHGKFFSKSMTTAG